MRGRDAPTKAPTEAPTEAREENDRKPECCGQGHSHLAYTGDSKHPIQGRDDGEWALLLMQTIHLETTPHVFFFG